MRNLSRIAQVYISLVLCVGVALLLWQGASLGQVREEGVWLTWVVFTALAGLTQLFKVTTPKHQNYALGAAFVFAALLLLPPGLVALLVLLAHLPEWVRFRYPWYIQSFNIAADIIAVLLAKAIFIFLGGSLGGLPGVWAAVAAAGAFAVANHTLVALVLLLARGIPFRESGTLDPDNLLTDFVLLCLGGGVAILWQINPWLILLGSSPLILIYRSLNIPTLKEEARVDAKTGLYNVKHFAQVLNEELGRATRFERPLAVIMADLDLLRNINNSYGHLAGDVVLRGVAEIIKSNLREYDLPARFGGEEFAILLPEADSEEASLVAERIRREVEEARFEVPTSDLPIRATISLGVAHFPEHGQEANEVVHQADLAIYQAKLSGRNKVCVASEVSLKLGLTRDFQESPRLPPLQGEPSFSRGERKGGPERRGEEPRLFNTTSERWSRPLIVFVGWVAVVGLALIVYYLPRLPYQHVGGVTLFTGLAILAEIFALDLYGGSSVSLSFVPIFAVALSYGFPGVAVLSPLVALAHALKFHNPPHKALFNMSAYALAGSVAAFVFGAFGYPLEVGRVLYLIVPTLLAALANYGVNSALVATAIALGARENLLSVWRERFGWLLGHYVVLGILGLLVALAYVSFGIYGLVAFIVPLMVIRYSQSMYIQRTLSSVAELRRVNQELLAATEEIGTINQELFTTLARMIDSRDPFVFGHSQKVADYAVAVARELGLPKEQMDLVLRAALVHDIGKVGIPEMILYKPSQLTEMELEYAQSHAILGTEFLNGCHSLHDLARLVRHHHEWYDGRGYPDGLAGEDIPLEARILALCDAVEAMASDRPYHRGMLIPEIIAELRRASGTQFDPLVVEAFVRVAQREGERLVINSTRQVNEHLPSERQPFGLGVGTYLPGS